MHGYLLGGDVVLHGLIRHCTLFHFRKCGLHGFHLDHLCRVLCKPTRYFPVVIQDFLSFGYCDTLKDGLARTVKVFRNGTRTSLLLSPGVPCMQTWPIIRNKRCYQLLHCFCLLVICLAYKQFKEHKRQQQFKRPTL